MNTSLRFGLTSLLLSVGIIWSTSAAAQELNCRVQVIAPQIANIEASIFESLEENIQEFMNGRRWTNDDFNLRTHRMHDANHISEAPSPTSFRGNIQVQSSVLFNSDYNSAMLLVNDGDFEIRGTAAATSNSASTNTATTSPPSGLLRVHDFGHGLRQHGVGRRHHTTSRRRPSSPMHKTLAYGMESEPRQSKPLLVGREHASQTFRPVRNCLYYYHRMGLDQLFDDVEAGRLAMADALIEMRQTHRIRPSSYNLQLFFLAKSDEILKVFGPAPEAEKTRLLPVLKQMDPGNISKYDSILG